MKIYTIKDIARLSGVSVTTVSRVLNHRPDVNPETRERVERIMRDCHFVGNANARGLKQADSDMVAVILRGRLNPFLSALAEAILQRTISSDFTYLTEFIDEKADEFQTALRLYHEKRVKGFIFVGSRIDERAKVMDGVDVPMVFATVSTAGTLLERASSVSIDDRAMSREVIEALLRSGHRRIAVFGGDRTGGDCHAMRYLGVLDAFSALGFTFDESRYVETRFSLNDAYDTARTFFARKSDTTAVFCMADTVAMGVCRALHDIGRRVPADVSVVGFDGIELGKYFVPRLTTVAQPVDEIAGQTVNVLTDMLQNGAPPRHVVVSSALLMRESFC